MLVWVLGLGLGGFACGLYVGFGLWGPDSVRGFPNRSGVPSVERGEGDVEAHNHQFFLLFCPFSKKII